MFEDIQSFFTTRPKRQTSSLGAGASAEDDPAMPAFQAAWKDGTLVEDMFGPNPFTLHGSVGRSGADNFRPDVAKVETFLGDAGYYKPLTSDGPSGWHNSNLDQAIRGFQKDKGLEVDGFLKPGGPTIGKIGSLLGSGDTQSQETETPIDPWEVKGQGRDPWEPNTQKPPVWQSPTGDNNDDSQDPVPFPGQPRPPSSLPPGAEPMPSAGPGVSNIVAPRPSQEEIGRYEAKYRKWVQDNWDAIQKNRDLTRLGLPTISLPSPPHDPRKGLPGVDYAIDPAAAKSSPAGGPDPFPNHTINQDGIDANQGYAEMLVRDSDPSQTARILKRTIDDYGDQGRGDIADLLARFRQVDKGKAEFLRRELHKASGEMLPYRLAPLGDGFREPTDEEKIAAAPKTPFGSARGADRWAAGNMAEVLLGKSDYTDAITHFRGEIGRDRDAAMPYLAAIHEIMGEKNPGLATKFVTQMNRAGLMAEAETRPEPAPEPAPTPEPTPTPELTPEPPEPTPTPELTPTPIPPVPAPAPEPTAEPVAQPAPQPQAQPQPSSSPPPSGQPEQPKEPGAEDGQTKPSQTGRPPVDGHVAGKSIEEIKKEAEANGGHLYTQQDKDRGNDKQCTALVKQATGLGQASGWRAGDQIKGPDDPPLKPGTAIATFNDNGTYGTDKGRHAALFVGYTEKNGQKGMEVLEQSEKRKVEIKFIPFSNSGKFIYQAGNYSVIKK